jgi:hypothetical protein
MTILTVRICTIILLAATVAARASDSREPLEDAARRDDAAARPISRPAKPAAPLSAADLMVRQWASGERVEVIARGEITVHPKLAGSITPGGKLHLRLVDIGKLGRPFIFREYTNVRFPLQYEVKTSDFVSPIGLGALTDRKYYIEALYYDFSIDGRKVRKWEAALGQGWGPPGRPYPLALGQRRDIQLSGWDSAETAGMLGQPDGEKHAAFGWVWISRGVQEQIRADQQIKATISFFDAADKKSAAAFLTTEVTIPHVGEPVHWYVNDPSLDSDRKGYVKVTGTALDRDGRICEFHGGRASPKVNIQLQTRVLKVVVVELSRCKGRALPATEH